MEGNFVGAIFKEANEKCTDLGHGDNIESERPKDSAQFEQPEVKNSFGRELYTKVYEDSERPMDRGPTKKELKDESEKKGLTDEEKLRIKEETGWSDEIIDAIESMEEYEIYKEAGLKEAEIDGKKCLIRDDIDWEQKDGKGRTNRERVEQGLSPINKDGKVIELHHIGQHADSPLAELTKDEHRGKGNDTILHNKKKETEVHNDENAWAKERSDHWSERANESEVKK